MGREYAIGELDGRRVLLAIHCDAPGCTARITPRSDAAQTGWTKRGQMNDSGNSLEWNYCPEHSR